MRSLRRPARYRFRTGRAKIYVLTPDQLAFAERLRFAFWRMPKHVLCGKVSGRFETEAVTLSLDHEIDWKVTGYQKIFGTTYALLKEGPSTKRLNVEPTALRYM